MTVPAGGFALPTNAEIDALIARVAPDARVCRLGGSMSLNFHLERRDGALSTGGHDEVVLRLHPRYVSRRRLRAVQELRWQASSRGLVVPIPVEHDGAAVVRCGPCLGELETYVHHTALAADDEAYPWLFEAMGRLHRVTAQFDVALSRPLLCFFAAPTTLLRWAERTRQAVSGDQQAAELGDHLRRVVNRLRTMWIPAHQLACQPVHGDINVDNVGRSTDGGPVYLDFGFSARRPRIHDIVYTLGRSVFTEGSELPVDPETVPWHRIDELVARYEQAAGQPLRQLERRALWQYTVAVLLFDPAGVWLSQDPTAELQRMQPFQQFAAWLLEHPDALIPHR